MDVESSAAINLHAWDGPPDPTLVFTILCKYLQSATASTIGIDAATTAEQITNQLTVARSKLLETDPLHPQSLVFSLFCLVLHISTQIPPNHIWHRRLVAFMKALRDQPPPPKACTKTIEASGIIWNKEGFRWKDYPGLAMEQGESFDYKNRWGVKQCPDENRWSVEEWTNINAFLAMLVQDVLSGEGENTFGFDGSGLKCLRYALELRRDAEELDENVPAAAVWIINAGTYLRSHAGLGIHSGWQLGPRHANEETDEYNGPDGLSDERWQFWKTKWGKIASQGDVKERTRGWARAALAHMVAVETTWGL